MLSNRASKATGVATAVGLALWLSAGVLAVVDTSGTRVGVLPSLVFLALAGVLAAAAAWLSRPSWSAVLPLSLALLAVLPWLPVRVPELWLVWTGPALLFVWGGIAFCLTAVAIDARGLRATAAFTNARTAPWLAAVLALAALLAVRVAIGSPRGDEPHYLLITQSILQDGDLKIANNYERGDYLQYWSGFLGPHFSSPAASGALYSVHAPGIPALIAPAFAIGGYWAVVMWLAALVAFGSALVWKAAHAFTNDVAAAWFGWASTVLTVPVAVHGTLVYPDSIAGVALAGGTLALTRASSLRTAHWLVLGAIVSAMPWLHTRLALPAFMLGCALLMRLVTAVHARRAAWLDVAAFAAPAVLGLAGWLGFFRIVYGTFNPSAPYGDRVPLDLLSAATGLVGLAADQEYGLLANAPIHLLWAAGIWSIFKRDRRLAAELLVIVVPYVVASSGYQLWFGGSTPPARFLVPVVFPLGLATASLWTRQDAAGRSMSLGLLGLSVLVASVLAFGDGGDLAYNRDSGRARWLDWIAPLVDLPRALPSFFRADGTLSPHASDIATHLLIPAIVWIVCIAIAWPLFRTIVARLPNTVPARALATAVCILLAMAAAAQTTWTLAGGSHLTLARSQIRLLGSDDPRDRPVGVRLPGLAILPANAARTQLALTTSRMNEGPPGSLLFLTDVPPGDYRLRIAHKPPAEGKLFAGIGRATGAAWEWPLSEVAPDTAPFHLPVIASTLVVNGDAAAMRSVSDVALVPLPRRELPADASDARGRDAVRYGQVVAFAIDNRVNLEPDGFWVLGGRQPEVVMTLDNPASVIDLELRNVAVPNKIRLSAGRWSLERSLAPNELWRVRVPVAGLSTSFRIRFGVEQGLSSSQGPLGCRVEVH